MGSVGSELFWIVTEGRVVLDFEPPEPAAFGWLRRPEAGDDVPDCAPGLPSVARVKSWRTSGGAPARRPELTEVGTGDWPQRPAADARRSACAARDSSRRSLLRLIPSRRATCFSLSPRPGPWPVRHVRICWACGVNDDTQSPSARTSRRRYRFQAFAEAFFLGGFRDPFPETAPARSARDTRALITDGVAAAVDPDGPAAEPDPEVDPEDIPPGNPEAAAVAPAEPAPVEVPAWPTRLTTEPTADPIEEPPRVAPTVGDEEVGVPRPEINDDAAGVAGVETLGTDTLRVVTEGTVAVGDLTDGTVPTGVVIFGVVTVGVVIFGVVTVGVVIFGVVTVGVVIFGVVTVGVVTFGVVTVGVVRAGVVIFGVLPTGVEIFGVDTDGTATLATLTCGVLTAGAFTAEALTAGAFAAAVLTAGVFTAGVLTAGAFTAGTLTAGALTAGAFTAGALTAGAWTGALTAGALTGALTAGALTGAALTAGALTACALPTAVLTEGTLTGGTATDEVVGSDWSADATAARMSARPTMVAAKKLRRLVCAARLDPETRIGFPLVAAYQGSTHCSQNRTKTT